MDGKLWALTRLTRGVIYNEATNNIPAGESLIWTLAKQTGRFEKALRYPAEDGDYEKPFIDKLGP
ncbi:hypothetical protein [Parapedobacter sp. 2B3]|uniref:hypothetical protein n=1 Tax=Parapedobacter sp. 2B3 TaxID=3342381 RepID=UPI0035B61A87